MAVYRDARGQEVHSYVGDVVVTDLAGRPLHRDSAQEWQNYLDTVGDRSVRRSRSMTTSDEDWWEAAEEEPRMTTTEQDRWKAGQKLAHQQLPCKKPG